MKNITTVIVNYQTPELLDQAVRSFKKLYPDVTTVIFDNGSNDHSKKTIDKLKNDFPGNLKTHFEQENIYHGPALHKSLKKLVSTPYCFFLDSDTITQKRGFLEEGIDMLEENSKHYVCGLVIKVNKRGFKDPDGIPVAVTPYLLLKTGLYHQFPPFNHHGQPTLKNIEKAQERGFKVIDYPMDQYIDHLWRGTASKYGYKLGLKGKLDYLLNRLGL